MDNENTTNKFEDFKYAVRHKARQAKRKIGELVDWCNENKAAAAAMGLMAFKIIREGHRIYEHHEAVNRKNKSMYDPKLDLYWELRKKPSNNELIMVEERVKHGEDRGKVLSDMRLLK